MSGSFTSVRSRAACARRFGGSQSGTAAVEMAFVLPVFLALVFGTVEFGRVMYSKVAFEYAILQASRYGRVTKTADTTKIKKALSDSLLLLDSSHLKDVSLNETVNSDKTRTATLKASYQFDFILPMMETNSLTFSKSVTFLRP